MSRSVTNLIPDPADGLAGNIGRFVRSRRKAGRLTQRELGHLAGVGTRFVSELERGKTSVRLSEVEKVLAVFGKTLDIANSPRQDETR